MSYQLTSHKHIVLRHVSEFTPRHSFYCQPLNSTAVNQETRQSDFLGVKNATYYLYLEKQAEGRRMKGCRMERSSTSMYTM